MVQTGSVPATHWKVAEPLSANAFVAAYVGMNSIDKVKTVARIAPLRTDFLIILLQLLRTSTIKVSLKEIPETITSEDLMSIQVFDINS
jgi:hypothetical protein